MHLGWHLRFQGTVHQPLSSRWAALRMLDSVSGPRKPPKCRIFLYLRLFVSSIRVVPFSTSHPRRPCVRLALVEPNSLSRIIANKGNRWVVCHTYFTEPKSTVHRSSIGVSSAGSKPFRVSEAGRKCASSRKIRSSIFVLNSEFFGSEMSNKPFSSLMRESDIRHLQPCFLRYASSSVVSPLHFAFRLVFLRQNTFCRRGCSLPRCGERVHLPLEYPQLA